MTCTNPKCRNTLYGRRTKFCSDKCSAIVFYYEKRVCKPMPMETKGKITSASLAYEYYTAGMTIKQIADHFNVSEHAVRKAFRESDYKLKATCPYCGKEFLTDKHNRKICSEMCRVTASRIGRESFKKRIMELNNYRQVA